MGCFGVRKSWSLTLTACLSLMPEPGKSTLQILVGVDMAKGGVSSWTFLRIRYIAVYDVYVQINAQIYIHLYVLYMCMCIYIYIHTYISRYIYTNIYIHHYISRYIYTIIYIYIIIYLDTSIPLYWHDLKCSRTDCMYLTRPYCNNDEHIDWLLYKVRPRFTIAIWAMVNTHYMVDGHPTHNKDPYNGYYKSLWTIGWLAPINGY